MGFVKTLFWFFQFISSGPLDNSFFVSFLTFFKNSKKMNSLCIFTLFCSICSLFLNVFYFMPLKNSWFLFLHFCIFLFFSVSRHTWDPNLLFLALFLLIFWQFFEFWFFSALHFYLSIHFSHFLEIFEKKLLWFHLLWRFWTFNFAIFWPFFRILGIFCASIFTFCSFLHFYFFTKSSRRVFY